MGAKELGTDEIDGFLKDQGDGVLSLTDGGETYAVPEAFGYDGEDVYFQFVFTEDSQKRDFIETTEIATLTVYSTESGGSVAVRGYLECLSDNGEMGAVAALTDNANIPAVNTDLSYDSDDLIVEFYRLRIEELSGRDFEGLRGPVSGP